MARKHTVYTSVDGRRKVPGAFSTILAMGAKGATHEEHIESYCITFSPEEVLEREIKLLVCRREEGTPRRRFVDEPGL